tara:strand:- start:15255 stop:15695 length:441 start_codon:yes stop_codon:yes gene_type:complete
MAIYLSDYLSPSAGSVTGAGSVDTISDEYAYHAFERDADGLLTYTKVKLNGTEAVELTNDGGFAYNGLEDMLDGSLDDGETQVNSLPVGYTETGRNQWDTNIGFRNHDQFRFDNLKLFYYLNSDGKIVARYKQDYVYVSTGGSTAV